MATEPLTQLWATIEQRKQQRPAGSYTVQLLEAGENEILKKIGEEAVEVIIAAKGEGDDRVLYELADLIYHSMVLLAARDLAWSDAMLTSAVFYDCDGDALLVQAAPSGPACHTGNVSCFYRELRFDDVLAADAARRGAGEPVFVWPAEAAEGADS